MAKVLKSIVCDYQRASLMMRNARGYAATTKILMFADMYIRPTEEITLDWIIQDDCQFLSNPAAVNSYFAMELIFKSLTGKNGSYLNTHHLDVLYGELSLEQQDAMARIFEQSYDVRRKNIVEYLIKSSNAFVEERYAHEYSDKYHHVHSDLALELWMYAAEEFPEFKWILSEKRFP